MSREAVEAAIRDAFAGVRLGRGNSISMTELIDEWADPAIVERLAGSEPDEDWASISPADLDRAIVAHFDPEGLRYYLPALMLRLLDDYDPLESWCSGTIGALDQRRGHPQGFLKLLSRTQRRATALYVKALPDLVELSQSDAAILSRALRDVWSQQLGEGS